MTCFVFLGPSLPRSEARELLDAEYLPPVAMGELYALVRTRARRGDRIAIVDGLFEQVPAVWHKEVLFALEQGIAVYGASSMGALRAAELHPFGMTGVGRIFAAYRDGVIEDDDEVVVAHATEDNGFRSLSHAMISLRFGLAVLRDDGAITADQCEALTCHAKSLHYGSRSWGATVQHARAQGYPAAVLAALRSTAKSYDAKADDARLLLRALAQDEQAGESVTPPDLIMEQTAFWMELTETRDAQIAHAAQGIPEDALGLVTQVRACHPQRDAVLARAALLRIAAERTRGWTPMPADLTAAAFRLLRDRGLSDPDEASRWRDAQGLSTQCSWRELLDLEARVDLITHHHTARPFIIPALKAMGLYAGAKHDAQAVEGSAGVDRTKHLSLVDAGVEPEVLQRWYEQRCGRMMPNPEAHAAKLGFETLRDFIGEILPAYLQAQGDQDSADERRQATG